MYIYYIYIEPLGSQKLSLPVLLSAENWKKSGRWNASKGEVKDGKKPRHLYYVNITIIKYNTYYYYYNLVLSIKRSSRYRHAIIAYS